jgi:hypothetical protein
MKTRKQIKIELFRKELSIEKLLQESLMQNNLNENDFNTIKFYYAHYIKHGLDKIINQIGRDAQ